VHWGERLPGIDYCMFRERGSVVTAQDAVAAGECSAFLMREILPDIRTLENVPIQSCCELGLCEETIDPLLRKAWEAGRQYGKSEEK
jgi:hypothetical protein